MSHYATVDKLGYLPMRHSGSGRATEGEQVGGTIDLDQRYVTYGVQMVRRHCGFGDSAHYEDDVDARGDILAGCYWPTASEGARPTGAWRWGAWPAIITTAGTLDPSGTSDAIAKPIYGSVFAADSRFAGMSVSALGSPGVGTRGLVVSGNNEDAQEALFFPIGEGVDTAHWRSTPGAPEVAPSLSTYVQDAPSVAGGVAPKARRDTWQRVTGWAPPITTPPAPPITPAPAEDSHGIAWLIGPTVTGRRGLGFGLVTDPSRGTVGFAGRERGGPWTLPAYPVSDLPAVDNGLDQHLLGITLDGEGVFPVHMSQQTIWYGTYTPSDEPLVADGPFHFEGKYPGAGGFPRAALVHLEYDKFAAHEILSLDGAPIPCSGKWKWWAEVPQNPPTPPPGGRGPGCGSGGGIAHAMPALTPLELGGPAIAWRPQVTWQDDPGFAGDLDITRYQTRRPTPEEDAAINLAPITARLEAVGARLSGEWTRDQVAQPRYKCGTGPGSILVLPGAWGAEDARLRSTTRPIENPSESGMSFVRTTLGAGCVEWNPETGSGAAGLFTYRDGTTNTDDVRTQMRDDAGVADAGVTWVIEATTRFDGAVGFSTGVALGGGGAATLGNTGGNGPTATAQAGWLQIQVNGVTRWLAVWQ